MNALMSPHIVRLTRIDEEVGLGTCLDALGKERQTVLRHYCFIVIARDDLQLTLQVLGFAQQAILEAERIYGEDNWSLDTILQEKGNLHLYEKLGYRQIGKIEKISDIMDIVYYEKN